MTIQAAPDRNGSPGSRWRSGVRATLGVAIGLMCVTAPATSQDLSQYRDFTLGADLASVSATAEVAATTAKLIHQRPARLEDLEWRPSRWPAGTTTESTDPVEQIRFSIASGTTPVTEHENGPP